MQRCFRIGLAVAALLIGASAHGQGTQTGDITGLVRSPDGLPLPGVVVVASSSALQGQRTADTDVNGMYVLRGMPPGVYSVDFSLDNFQSLTQGDVEVTVGGTTDASATLLLAARTEAVVVTAPAPSPLSMRTPGRALGKEDIDTLPVGRRPVDLAEFSPGLTLGRFNAGQVTIGGAYGFDNVFMVNGVDTNDNIFGTANNLFIEDAIQEASVLTSAIPPSYGRFSGGVINIVTKSGGNTFSGSFRENLSNPSWIAETPREKRNSLTHKDILNTSHEGTFGGPIVKDRLWFFSAARYEQASTQNTFAQTNGAYTRTDTNKRGELKVTGSLKPGHTAQVSYINNSTQEANRGFSSTAIVDASTLITRQLPNDLLAVNYHGALNSALYGTVQYSQKRQGFRNNGGSSKNIEDSPFLTLGATQGVPAGLFFGAPYLDASDPEDRNNRQLTGSLSYLLSSPRAGTHDLSGGIEHFVSTGIGGNSQSSTGYVFATDYLTSAGVPVVDAKGVPVPVFIPNASQAWSFLATRGARVDITTTSLFFQDRWFVSPRLTLDLGARFEAVSGSATGDITTVDTTSISPRLAGTLDVTGDGKTILQGSYGQYSGKYGQVQFATNTNVGRPSEVDYVYTGPAGQGRDFAPGFDLQNYTEVVYANFPTANVRVASDLQSPVVREFTIGLGRELSRRSFVKATYVSRDTTHFVEDFVDLSRGTTDVPLVGALTNRVLANSDVPTRQYRALLLEGSYRTGEKLTVGANHTLQLRNNGNFAGEAANQPGITSVLGDYPEIFGPALNRLMPEGRLDGYQQHKLRVFGIYTQSFGRAGSLAVSPIWRVNSGAVYSLTARLALTPVQLARNPGYPANDINPGVRQIVYFGERGEETFKGYGVADLAATYSLPVWKTAAPWLKIEIYNVLNNQKQIAWDQTVSVDRSSPLDANGIPTGYTKGPRFGQATNDNQFPQPYPGQNGGRAFRMAFGLRF